MEYIRELVPKDIYNTLLKYEPETLQYEINRKPDHLTYWYKQALNSEIRYGHNELIRKQEHYCNSISNSSGNLPRSS
jgi:hypothetical protein